MRLLKKTSIHPTKATINIQNKLNNISTLPLQYHLTQLLQPISTTFQQFLHIRPTNHKLQTQNTTPNIQQNKIRIRKGSFINKTNNKMNMNEQREKDKSELIRKHILKGKQICINDARLLSHRLDIRFNGQMKDQQMTVIISYRIINPKPKLYFKNNHNNHKNKEIKEKDKDKDKDKDNKKKNIKQTKQNEIDPFSILPTLCNTKKNKNLFFKVHSPQQLQHLSSYLTENNIINYTGIINIKPQYIQQYILYDISQITIKNKIIILIQQLQTLLTQIPNNRDGIIIPITIESSKINQKIINKLCQAINSLQDISDQQYTYYDKQNKPITTQNLVQNSNNHHHSSKIYLQKQHQQYKYNSHPQFIIRSNLQFQNKQILLWNTSYLSSRLKQAEQSQKRIFLSNQIIDRCRPPISKTSKCLDIIRSSEFDKKKKMNRKYSLNLQGDYKQKMVQFVRIIQKQAHILRQKSKQAKTTQMDYNNDEVQQLTQSLTTRNTSKTSLQLLGDLIKSNKGICHQISQYLNEIDNIKPINKNIFRQMMMIYDNEVIIKQNRYQQICVYNIL